MVLMDMAAITPLLRALYRSLKPDARFVFSIPTRASIPTTLVGLIARTYLPFLPHGCVV
jgi:hypothetical protein